MQLFASQYINWWTGLLADYFHVFTSCLDSHSDGTHSLQRIHWWASDVMLNLVSWMHWGWENLTQLFYNFTNCGGFYFLVWWTKWTRTNLITLKTKLTFFKIMIWWYLNMSLREDAEPDGDTGDVEGATQGLPSRSSIQLQPSSPPAVMELDKRGAFY